MLNTPAPTEIYRPRRIYLFVSAFSTVFFSVAGISTVLIAGMNPDGSFSHPIQFAIFGGVFWLAWFLLSLWGLLGSYCEKLYFDTVSLIQCAVIHTKVIQFEDIIEINWLQGHGSHGGIEIVSGESKINIRLDNFTINQRYDLISYFSQAFVSTPQKGWLDFKDRYFEPSSITRETNTGIRLLFHFLLGSIFCFFWSLDLAGLSDVLLLCTIGNAIAVLWYLRKSTKE